MVAVYRWARHCVVERHYTGINCNGTNPVPGHRANGDRHDPNRSASTCNQRSNWQPTRQPSTRNNTNECQHNRRNRNPVVGRPVSSINYRSSADPPGSEASPTNSNKACLYPGIANYGISQHHAICHANTADGGIDFCQREPGGNSRARRSKPSFHPTGAFRDSFTAETYWASFSIRYPKLSKAHDKQIISADLGSQGTYHRLQLLGFADAASAQKQCRQLKADGTDCFAPDGAALKSIPRCQQNNLFNNQCCRLCTGRHQGQTPGDLRTLSPGRKWLALLASA